MAERRRALGPPHPRRVRREPAPAADRSHRPVPDAPHRPQRVVGRDLAGDGDARAAGQGHLRRQQQLRGLAHRAGERSRQGAALPRARERAEPLQPRVAHRRARSAPRVPASTGSASFRGARSRAACSAAPAPPATPPAARACNRVREHPPAARTVGEVLRRARRGTRRGRARVAAAPKGRDRADHRAAHDANSSKARRCARSI